jgi:long-chain acyl-CoA synthetase
VVLIGDNSIEWICSDFAIQSLGAATVPIYPNSTADVAAKIIANSQARFAIASSDALASKLRPGITKVVLFDEEIKAWVRRGPTRSADVAARLATLEPDGICTIVYTSGTTGDPKGVELEHHSLVDISRAAIKVHPITDQDSILSWLPYSHVFGRINEVFVSILFGGTLWISRGPEHLAEELRQVRPSIMCSAPRVYEKMYAAVMARVRDSGAVQRKLFGWAVDVGKRRFHTSTPGAVLQAQHRIADRLVLHSLRERLTGGELRFFISGGAALSREIEEFFWSIGVPILNGWGMTETSSGVCSNTLTEHRFLTVGKPFPGVEIKIADDGEILVKSPSNMRAYHNNPAATAEMLKDGWIYSGDIGEFDADGYLKITDRKKSLFKTAGGKYIAPVPIEQALMSNSLLVRAIVIGDGKPYVTALVVPDWQDAKKRGLDESAVRASIQKTVDEVNSHLGRWETIKYFTMLEHDFTEDDGELSLKLDVKRKVVADHYAKRIEAMYAERSEPS